ncbi:1-hydroxy-2-methyl-2-butenyl 4-diphosphate reductase [Kitasatospora sp. NPDC052896]|uniref:phosphorylase family protein n=1 Tax=Kitasatospora sp. NPDC052896 TaxID=3364061 RepID=UPI0037C69F99
MTGAPLLVLCALAPEEWALRRADWAQALHGPPVLARTGLGPVRAGRTADALLAAGGYGAVVVTGFCAAVAPGPAPGDLLVADEVRDAAGTAWPVAAPDALAEGLRTLGLTVRRGVLHSTDHVVRGPERGRLHRAGALAVDMESAAVLGRLPAGLPAAAVRVVVDTPGRELLRPGTLPAGLRAWRALRAAAPALLGWHRAVAAPAPRARPRSPEVFLSTHSSKPTLPQEAS